MFKTIVYHLIGNPNPELTFQQKRMYVDCNNFETHIVTLKNMGYRFITLNEAEKELLYDTDSNNKEILITFDDGYTNTIEIALPILKKHNVPAAMSVCGSYLYPETRDNIDMHADKNFVGVEGVKLWINAGNSILAHTYSHYKLTHLSETVYKKEIEKDYLILQKEFGTAPNGIAYPYGSINDAIISVVSKYYQYGFATNMGFSTSWENRYRLKRICAESNCSIEELLKLINE